MAGDSVCGAASKSVSSRMKVGLTSRVCIACQYCSDGDRRAEEADDDEDDRGSCSSMASDSMASLTGAGGDFIFFSAVMSLRDRDDRETVEAAAEEEADGRRDEVADWVEEADDEDGETGLLLSGLMVVSERVGILLPAVTLAPSPTSASFSSFTGLITGDAVLLPFLLCPALVTRTLTFRPCPPLARRLDLLVGAAVGALGLMSSTRLCWREWAGRMVAVVEGDCTFSSSTGLSFSSARPTTAAAGLAVSFSLDKRFSLVERRDLPCCFSSSSL